MRENLGRGKKLCLALCALLCCALFPAAALAEVEAPLRAAFASDDSRSSFLASLNSVGLPGQECQDGESPALALYQKSALEQASVIALSDGYAGTGVRFPDEMIVTYGQTLQEGRFIGGEGAGSEQGTGSFPKYDTSIIKKFLSLCKGGRSFFALNRCCKYS